MAELEAQRGHESSGEAKEESSPALEELEQLVKARDEVRGRCRPPGGSEAKLTISDGGFLPWLFP